MEQVACVLRTQAEITTSRGSPPSASGKTTAPGAQAAVVYRQPVLQNAGAGAAGGVQVSYHCCLVPRGITTPMSTVSL